MLYYTIFHNTEHYVAIKSQTDWVIELSGRIFAWSAQVCEFSFQRGKTKIE